MPELPEVETIKNEITPHLLGQRITDVNLLWEGIARHISLEELCSNAIGKVINSISRRGKYLILKLDNNGKFLIFHLKMSGSLLLRPASAEIPKYTRAIIQLDNGTKIFFRDPRKFGRIWLVDKSEEITGELGPEPLENSFTPECLAQILAKRHGPIKALLTDQTLIAGIGNMYADEALFAAGIHPLRAGSSLTENEIKRLHRAIQQVLEAGIYHKGASIVNYYRPDGSEGTAHNEFKVAHQRGKPCPVCGGPVERILVRGRGTYFCPKCQK